MNWIQRLFGGTRKTAPHRAAPRDDEAPQRIDLASYTPELPQFLALAATVQKEFELTIRDAQTLAPSPAARKLVSTAADAAAEKARAFEELAASRKVVIRQIERMLEPEIEGFRSRTTGADWWERVLTWYITSGLLDDVLLGLSTGLRPKDARAVADILTEVSGRNAVASMLSEAIADDNRLANRLALWGRRLVGDTLLVARLALHVTPGDTSVEPVFGELMAGHAKRMSRLGLTA